MLRKAALSLTLVLSVVSVAFALTPAGRWQGTIDAGGMPLAMRLALTVQGETLSGSAELPEYGAEFPIESPVVKGDSVRFTVDFAGQATLRARGQVVADTLFLMADIGAGETAAKFTRTP
jgi:hypothetical protein